MFQLCDYCFTKNVTILQRVNKRSFVEIADDEHCLPSKKQKLDEHLQSATDSDDCTAFFDGEDKVEYFAFETCYCKMLLQLRSNRPLTETSYLMSFILKQVTLLHG